MTDHKAEWVLVPRKLCEAQHLAFHNFHDDDDGRAPVRSADLTAGDRAVTQRQWEAMLAAAPAASEGPACKHKWRNSDRPDPMLPCAWIQVCKKCGALEDEI